MCDLESVGGHQSFFLLRVVDVFSIMDKVKTSGEEVKGVGVIKDEETKLQEIEPSHTLGGVGDWEFGIPKESEVYKRLEVCEWEG